MNSSDLVLVNILAALYFALALRILIWHLSISFVLHKKGLPPFPRGFVLFFIPRTVLWPYYLVKAPKSFFYSYILGKQPTIKFEKRGRR